MGLTLANLEFRFAKLYFETGGDRGDFSMSELPRGKWSAGAGPGMITYGVAFRGGVSRSFSVFEFVTAMVGGDELELVLRADVLQGARRTSDDTAS